MWVLVIMMHIDGSSISSIEIPNRPTRSACMNEGQRQKALLKAENKSLSVTYRCFKK